jgi:hypothetical protein
MEDRHYWRGRPKRGPSRIKIPRPCPVATMERIPPPKPRRNEDALYETAGSAAHGAGLRPPSRGASGPYRRAQPLYGARHTRHGSCGISPSGERGNSAFNRFVQQSRLSGVRSRPKRRLSCCEARSIGSSDTGLAVGGAEQAPMRSIAPDLKNDGIGGRDITAQMPRLKDRLAKGLAPIIPLAGNATLLEVTYARLRAPKVNLPCRGRGWVGWPW